MSRHDYRTRGKTRAGSTRDDVAIPMLTTHWKREIGLKIFGCVSIHDLYRMNQASLSQSPETTKGSGVMPLSRYEAMTWLGGWAGYTLAEVDCAAMVARIIFPFKFRLNDRCSVQLEQGGKEQYTNIVPAVVNVKPPQSTTQTLVPDPSFGPRKSSTGRVTTSRPDAAGPGSAITWDACSGSGNAVPPRCIAGRILSGGFHVVAIRPLSVLSAIDSALHRSPRWTVGAKCAHTRREYRFL